MATILAKIGPLQRACLLLACIVLTTLPAAAEVPVVANGAEAPGGLTTVPLREAWRAGGEDDDIFFGFVGAVRTDAAGQVLVLDTQLAEVQVYGRDGSHQATLGREGDGPGETRRPGDMFVALDGTIYLLQSMPGRIVGLHPDGTPADQKTYSSGGAGGQFAVLNRGLPLPDGNFAMVGIRMSFGAGGTSDQTYFLDRCDAQAARQVPLLEKQSVVDYNEFVMDELSMDWVYGRVAVDDQGRVYAVPERNDYAIHVFAPDGTTERIITRTYAPVPRNKAQRAASRALHEGIGAYYPTPPRRIDIQDSEPDVYNLYVTDDGRLWAQVSTPPPAGAFAVFDVFAPDGTLEKQVALAGDHDPVNDAIYVLPDRRVVVVKGALEAFLNQQAVGEEAATESTPLEVICYDTDLD